VFLLLPLHVAILCCPGELTLTIELDEAVLEGFLLIAAAASVFPPILLSVLKIAPTQGVREHFQSRLADALLARERVLLVNIMPAMVIVHVCCARAPCARPHAQVVAIP
jgi:hypothetical protein